MSESECECAHDTPRTEILGKVDTQIPTGQWECLSLGIFTASVWLYWDTVHSTCEDEKVS